MIESKNQSEAAVFEVERTRKIAVYRKSVEENFRFLKQCTRLDQLLVSGLLLPLSGGYLVPVCELHANDSALIALLSQWRRDNSFAYPSQFQVTDEGTASWLRSKLLDVPDRLLFLVLNRFGTPIGHLGLANCLNDSCEVEIDNVVRGDKHDNLGIMSEAMRVLIRWTEETIAPNSIFLRVFKDNDHAISFYQKLGFLVELEIPYCLATSGRPGPCWIEIPMDIQSTLVEQDELLLLTANERETLSRPPAMVTQENLSEAVAAVASGLREAKRPLLWLGIGIRLAGAASKMQTFLEKLRVPSLVSWSGIDLIDSNHPLVYGRAGVCGNRSANFILQNCDYLLTIGTRLAIPQVGYDITELARAASITVVDIDEAELDKYRVRYERTICTDAGDFLSQLQSAFDKQFSAPAEWIDRCNSYRERYPMVGPENADQNGFINSYRFMEKLSLHMKPDQVVVTDAGSSFVCAGQVLKITPPQRLMASRGLGEMGFGLPGSIGASFARDRGEVLCLNCDGSMMMNLQELQTIVHHKLPIKIIILSNDGYLSIKHTQNAWFEGRHTSVDRRSGVSCPDYSALAGAFGIPSFQIRTWDDFEDVMPRMLALPGPAICEVFMDPEQPFAPKLAAVLQDGRLISPPLEDLSPQLPRKEFTENMLIGIHPKSVALNS